MQAPAPEVLPNEPEITKEEISDVGDPSSDDEQYLPVENNKPSVAEEEIIEEIIDEINTEDFQKEAENITLSEETCLFFI